MNLGTIHAAQRPQLIDRPAFDQLARATSLSVVRSPVISSAAALWALATVTMGISPEAVEKCIPLVPLTGAGGAPVSLGAENANR